MTFLEAAKLTQDDLAWAASAEGQALIEEIATGEAFHGLMLQAIKTAFEANKPSEAVYLSLFIGGLRIGQKMGIGTTSGIVQ